MKNSEGKIMKHSEAIYYVREKGSPNKTRVKVLGVDFKVSADKKKVVAIMKWQPVVDFTAEWFGPQVSRGVASLRPGDEFDERKGQRIALARAESAAYDELTKIVRAHKKIALQLINEMDRFLNLSRKVRRGNSTFIKRVDAGEV